MIFPVKKIKELNHDLHTKFRLSKESHYVAKNEKANKKHHFVPPLFLMLSPMIILSNPLTYDRLEINRIF